LVSVEKSIRADQTQPEKISFDYSIPKTIGITLRGNWQIFGALPAFEDIATQLFGHAGADQIIFDSSKLEKWDSSLVAFLRRLVGECDRKKISVSREGLPQGTQKLLALALVDDKKRVLNQTAKEPIFARVSEKVLRVGQETLSLLDFLGGLAVSFGRFLSAKTYFRRDEFAYIIQRSGADALPLVSLISVLVGMILAFIGAAQLKLFGAQVYIADMVGIAMVRVMGAVMTGILMAGRTGATYAAELGIMQTNEEIDALRTLGLYPADFLVLPRVLALTIMMPLLTLYADFMGMLGGFVVSTTMFNINVSAYITHTQEAVKLVNVWIGLIHGFVFGIVIAIAGCFCGIHCDRSAAGVGEATTAAVVSAITGIVIATAIITFICQVLGV